MSDTYSIFLDRPDIIGSALSPSAIPDFIPTQLPMTENFSSVPLSDPQFDYAIDGYQVLPVADSHGYSYQPQTYHDLPQHSYNDMYRPHFDKAVDFNTQMATGHSLSAPVSMYFSPELAADHTRVADHTRMDHTRMDHSRPGADPLYPVYHSHHQHTHGDPHPHQSHGGHPSQMPDQVSMVGFELHAPMHEPASDPASHDMLPVNFMAPVPFGDLEFSHSLIKNEHKLPYQLQLPYPDPAPRLPVRRMRRKSVSVHHERRSPKQTHRLGKFRIVRGITAGGASTRPPKQEPGLGCRFVPAELAIHSASMDDLCLLSWDDNEMADRRRIIRIERTQNGAKVNAAFLVVGLAAAHPNPAPAPVGTDVLEVSCLQCFSLEANHDDADDLDVNYYITSVEVVGIVEMLIDMRDMDLVSRRRERGRIRSNLMPFWLKKAVSSKKNSESEPGDPRMEFARRIMAYDVRKPRGFDKDVRILRWEKLLPALQRALQCYYVEVPE